MTTHQQLACFLDHTGATLTLCRALAGTSGEWRCSLLSPPVFAFGRTAREAITALRAKLRATP